MDLEDQPGVGDGLGLGLEGQEAAEPDTDGLAIVVGRSARLDGERLGFAEADRDREQAVDGEVDPAGGEGDASHGDAAVDEQEKADDADPAVDAASDRREEVLGVLADAESVRDARLPR